MIIIVPPVSAEQLARGAPDNQWWAVVYVWGMAALAVVAVGYIAVALLNGAWWLEAFQGIFIVLLGSPILMIVCLICGHIADAIAAKRRKSEEVS